MNTSSHPPSSIPVSPWSPLKRPLFRALWIATIVSNVGTWMHEVGAGWLMVTLSSDPLMVALIQAATALPIFFLALPAGALADIVDRRRFLLGAQLWMLTCALLLGIMTLVGLTNAWLLLALTFALGIGSAMMTPAWAATVPELVPREELQPAISLNSLGVNVSRAIGPALAGVIVAAAGPSAAFMLNAVSFLGVVVVLARWRRETAPSTLPAERFFSAMRAGMRYVREAHALQAVMVRAVSFFLFATALWSLLPLIAKGQTQGGAAAYGVLLASIGAGAVSGALLLPRIRRKIGRDTLVRGATAIYAAMLAAAALLNSVRFLVPVMIVSGAMWLSVVSTFHVSAQTAVPAWVRARALSIYLVAFAAGTVGGSTLWGMVAARTSVSTALLAAAAGALLAIVATRRFSLEVPDALGAAGAHWPEPIAHDDLDLEPDRGPVMVTVEYRVDPARAQAFGAAMQELASVRRRDGASSWGLFKDTADPERYIEFFLVESWVEHLRQHHRITQPDQELQARVRGFHTGSEPPRVSHLIAEIF